MQCPNCNKQFKELYKPNSTYEDLWHDFLDIDAKVNIYCPEPTCLPGTIIATEEPRPDRLVLTFGKHKGKQLSEVDDHGYLEWLARSESTDLLTKACIYKII